MASPLSAYRLATDGILATFSALVGAILRAGYRPDERADGLRGLTPALTEAVRGARAQVYQHAVTALVETARQQGVRDPYTPDLSGYPEAAVESVLRRELRGPADDVLPRITLILSQHVESAGRQTVVRAVEDGVAGSPAEDTHLEATRLDGDELAARRAAGQVTGRARPHAWARVLSGAENCAFCVMLASRGPVYSSAAAAGRGKASDLLGIPEAKGWLNSYHPGCDCMVVPVYDYSRWPGVDDYHALARFYDQQVTRAVWTDADGVKHRGITARSGPSSRADNQVIAALDRELSRMSRAGESLPVSDLRAG